MKKTITQGDCSVGAMDMASDLLTELGIPFEKVTDESGTQLIEYYPPSVEPLYTKWLNFGFLDKLEIAHKLPMAGVFEQLGQFLTSTAHLEIAKCNHFLKKSGKIHTLVYPIARRVY